RVPDTERRALSTLQRSRFRRVDKRSASTIRLADGARSAEATQIWNCWRLRRHCSGWAPLLYYGTFFPPVRHYGIQMWDRGSA
ncbi:hypothetical protein, partial [uncultured Lamprocystis sp.]|uniref:hypothetical protein n=1 Tax=uncultured Lamprocystis sp. TaxID=543132 RepID=UPI0025F28063